MPKHDDIADLFREHEDHDSESDLIPSVMRQTKRAVGQQDTADLIFVKIWAAMAVLLAPLFAKAAARHAQAKQEAVKPAIQAEQNNMDSTQHAGDAQ